MNRMIALEIFTLGVKFGNEKTKTGLDIDKQSDDRLTEILKDGFNKYIEQIEKLLPELQVVHDRNLFYSQYFTCKQAFRFGCIAGFHQWPKVKADSKGDKILTDETIDKLTQMHFRNVRGPHDNG